MNKSKKLMKKAALSTITLGIGLAMGVFATTQAQSSGKVFELRTYTATPGNLDNLHARFRNHTTRIFRKHGMATGHRLAMKNAMTLWFIS